MNFLRRFSTRLFFLVVIAIVLGAIRNRVTLTTSTGNEGKSDKNLTIGDGFDNLMWFVQVSDLHLSKFFDPTRISAFRKFCNETIPLINPDVVLITGDMVEARDETYHGTKQFQEEWETYKNILEETKVAENRVWLDIRGNHDVYNTPKTLNLYKDYSIQGNQHRRSYMHRVTKGNQNYSFILVDAVPEPGPRLSISFTGQVFDEDYQLLEKFKRDTLDKGDYVVWAGHYPTAYIYGVQRIRDVLKGGYVYLTGHLHTFMGRLDKLYTRQREGFLELELADFRKQRIYRIAAIDHRLFSFVDVKMDKWPAVLLTNPKDPMFYIPSIESLDTVRRSTHVRLLVFSPTKLDTVRIRIDGNPEWTDCRHVNGPLYVSPWNATLYSKGMHQIHVYARNSDGQINEFSHPFTVESHIALNLDFDLVVKLILMLGPMDVIFVGLPTMCISVICLMIYFRKAKNLLGNGSSLWRGLRILSSIDEFYYPIVLYPVYLLIGPYFAGEIMDGYWGATFFWGTYVEGTYIPPDGLGSVHGLIFFLLIYTPFLTGLSLELNAKKNGKGRSLCSLSTLFYTIALSWQFISAYFIYKEYSLREALLAPPRTWGLALGIYLWKCVNRIGPIRERIRE